jgi:hypothetical protein
MVTGIFRVAEDRRIGQCRSRWCVCKSYPVELRILCSHGQYSVSKALPLPVAIGECGFAGAEVRNWRYTSLSAFHLNKPRRQHLLAD